MRWYFAERKVDFPNLVGIYFDTDIDECAEGIEECEEHCYNTVGSYVCNCTGPSYRLHTDGTSCESMLSHTNLIVVSEVYDYADVDECAEDTDGCAQLCTDTDGSYFCSCEAGFDLTEDQHGCTGKIIKRT